VDGALKRSDIPPIEKKNVDTLNKKMSLDLCNEVGNPKNFYFVYPAESATAGYLDINDAVKRDNGRTPVCMLYLTHMLGQERAVDMMANKKLREQHLVALKIPNYEGKGFDAVVLRYSDMPVMNELREPLGTVGTIINALSPAVGGVSGTFAIEKLVHCREEADEGICVENAAMALFVALAAIGIPIFNMVKEMKAHRNERERSRELESKLMGFKLRKWQETAESKAPESKIVETLATVAAGAGNPTRNHKSTRVDKSHRSHKARMYRKNEQEFRRLQSQSLEATVAGAGAPRTYRTR